MLYINGEEVINSMPGGFAPYCVFLGLSDEEEEE